MSKILQGAVVGAIALGCVSIAPVEASAMPVATAPAVAADVGVSEGAKVENVYWRYGWRRPWGWHRPWGYRYGWGWRRPWGYRYGWGWHRGWRRW